VDISGGTEGTGPLPSDVEIVDVWSRTQPKYRIRAAVFLAVCFVLFAGLCAFTHWLRVADAFDFSLSSYLSPFRFWGGQTQNLNDFLRYPINVEQRPIHGIVLGLLVASIVATPILVSILYRFVAALPFVAAVLIFAHLPWMSITLLCGCILASVRPFRMKFRFGSAVLGILPVVLYLILATQNKGEAADLPGSPAQRSLLIAPWLLSLLGTSAMLASVLTLAKLVKYRPGVIAPVIAVTFATPAILFYRYVGVDELEYRVLETRFGPQSAMFRPTGDWRPTVGRFIAQQWTSSGSRYAPDDELLAVWSGNVAGLHERVLQRMWREFLAERAAAYEACRQFISDYPDSRFVPAVLYLQARVMDTRIDERAMLGEMRRELYTDFPHTQSEQAWTALASGYPDSPFAAAAVVRLAQLKLRQGDVDTAYSLLESKHTPGSAQAGAAATSQPGLRSLLGRDVPASESLSFDAGSFEREAERWRELIAANRDDPVFGNEPLAVLASLDARRPGYTGALLRTALQFTNSKLYDNLIVAWSAAQLGRHDRETCLSACTRFFTEGDALAEAMFRLANIEVQSVGEGSTESRQRGIERMRDVATRFADTYWGEVAKDRLRMLAPSEDQLALSH
jgi:hypothetical protein